MFQNILEKFRYIFLPSLLLIIGFITVYSFFHWYFILEKEWISLDEEILTVFLPSFLLVILLIFSLASRFKLLKIRDSEIWYSMIIFFFIVILNGNIQNLIRRNHASLIKVADVSEIDNIEKIKYYEIEDFDIESGISSVFVDYKNGDDDFTVNVYIITPILSKTNDLKTDFRDYWLERTETLDILLENLSSEERKAFFSEERFKNIKYWYGSRFHKSLDYGNDYNEKNIEYFVRESLKEHKELNFHDVEYFEILDNSYHSRNFQKSLNKLEDLPQDSKVLYAIQDKFEDRTSENKSWIFWMSTVGILIWLIMILFPPFDKRALVRLKKGVKTRDDSFDFKKIVLPNREIIVTQFFLWTSIIFYLFLITKNIHPIYPNAGELIPFGTNYSPLVRSGEYWRLVTSLFINPGFEFFIHMVVFLGLIGIGIEKHIGHLKLLFIFLFTGVMGNIGICYWSIDGHSVGLIGAMFGFGGFLFLLEFLVDKSIDHEDIVFPSILLKIILFSCVIIGLFDIYSDYNIVYLTSFFSGVILGLIQYGYNRFVAR